MFTVMKVKGNEKKRKSKSRERKLDWCREEREKENGREQEMEV